MHSEVFSHLDPSPAAAENEGILAGMRAAVQSSLCVRGWPCDAGSRALEGFVPLEDATVVERLKRGGAVMIGNTRASELGWGLSRDGAAGAVAEGLVDVALMVDTLGEARLAAAGAGLFGFKPSWGRVSRFGLMGLVPSMECCGLVGRDLERLSRVFDAVSGRDERDPSMVDAEVNKGEGENGSGVSQWVAGVPTPLLEKLQADERAAFAQVLSRLEKTGLTMREVKADDGDLFSVVHQVIASVEASSSCGKYDGVRFGHRASGGKNWNEMYLETRRESFGPLLKTLLFQGAYFQFENYAAFENACRIRSRLVHESRALFQDLDVMLLPARRSLHDAAGAQSLKEVYDAFGLTLRSNLTGQPALTLPGLLRCGGVDLGLQIAGAFLDDERLLSLGRMIITQVEGVA